MTENNSYSIYAKCENCGFEGDLNIEKGVPVENQACPTCGVQKIIKIKKLRSKSYYSFK